MTGAGTTGEDRGAWAGSGGYSQVGKGSQVAEGALGEAGDVVAVEGSEAEAQVRSVPVTGRRARATLSRCPLAGLVSLGFHGSPSGGSRGPSSVLPPSSLRHGECVNISPAQLGSRGVAGRGLGKERSEQAWDGIRTQPPPPAGQWVSYFTFWASTFAPEKWRARAP